MKLNHFCSRLFPAFEREITDVEFQFIQNNDYLKKDYLDTVREDSSLQRVNSEFAHAGQKTTAIVAAIRRGRSRAAIDTEATRGVSHHHLLTEELGDALDVRCLVAPRLQH